MVPDLQIKPAQKFFQNMNFENIIVFLQPHLTFQDGFKSKEKKLFKQLE